MVSKEQKDKFLRYLSPEWMRMLDHTVARQKRDMGVYLAVGTGWPIGGAHVTPEDAATKLIVQQYDYTAGSKSNLIIRAKEEKQSCRCPVVCLNGL